MIVPRYATIFHVRAEQLVAHWIKNEILQPKSINHKNAELPDDNYGIAFKSNTRHYTRYCVEDKNMNPVGSAESLKRMITIYSIDQYSGLPNQKELGEFIRNDISEPLVIILEKNVLLNDEIMNALRNQLNMCNNQAEWSIGGNCVQMLGLYQRSYQIAEEEKRRKEQMLLEAQTSALNNMQASKKTYHDLLPKARNCLIQ